MSIVLPDPPKWVTLDQVLRGHRSEGYRVDLLTSADGYVGTLNGVEGCSVTLEAEVPIGSSGSITLRNENQDIDWSSARCQPWVKVNGQDWPLGVFLMSAPSAEYDGTGKGWSVELLDKATVLDGDKIIATYSLPVGSIVTDAVVSVINEAGEMRTAITPSDAVTAAPMVWPVGKSRLEIVTDLLNSINYTPLRVDGYGYFTSSPDVDPATRTSAFDFIEGENAIHLATFSVNQDLSAVPNRILCLWQASPETEIQRAVAENLDPADPLSYPRRKRWVTKVYENQEADSQATLDAIAARYLREENSLGEQVSFAHAAVPVTVREVVRFKSSDIDILGEVLKQDITLGVGEVWQATIRKVAPGV